MDLEEINKIPKNEEGKLLPPMYWPETMKPWKYLYRQQYDRYSKLIPKENNQTTVHYELKLATLALLEQCYGDIEKKITNEFSTSDSDYRPDMLFDDGDLRIAIEVGNLSNRKKIKNLVCEEGYDFVWWLPYPPFSNIDKSVHWVIDYQPLFLPYKVGILCLYTFGDGKEKYVATYNSLSKNIESDFIACWQLFSNNDKYFTDENPFTDYRNFYLKKEKLVST